MNLNGAVRLMTEVIVASLPGNKPTIYLYGSVASEDFKLGWSDIDILVLTEHEVTQHQANILVELRQSMLQRYPSNPYFRLFEGGIIAADAFLQGISSRTVYWGTSGQRIADSYKLDSFGMADLLDRGILLHGNDIRCHMAYPTYEQLRHDVASHTIAAREHGKTIGWLLDIARGVYTLRTGKIIAKTAAGEWALETDIFPNKAALHKAVEIRKNPCEFSYEDKYLANEIIHQYADVLEGELNHERAENHV